MFVIHEGFESTGYCSPRSVSWVYESHYMSPWCGDQPILRHTHENMNSQQICIHVRSRK